MARDFLVPNETNVIGIVYNGRSHSRATNATHRNEKAVYEPDGDDRVSIIAISNCHRVARKDISFIRFRLEIRLRENPEHFDQIFPLRNPNSPSALTPNFLIGFI